MAHDDIARYIDHSVLKPEMTRPQAVAAIELGLKYNCRTVCVRPVDIELARDLCRGSATAVCTVLAFPHGCCRTETKASEARACAAAGAAEIDMVANYGLIRSREWALVEADIRAVSDLTRASGVVLKVILETCALSEEEILRATEICVASGADFVKTSTGFAAQGATESAVRAMLRAAAGRIQVKAAGGIRDRQAAEFFLGLGCGRLGIGFASTPIVCGD